MCELKISVAQEASGQPPASEYPVGSDLRRKMHMILIMWVCGDAGRGGCTYHGARCTHCPLSWSRPPTNIRVRLPSLGCMAHWRSSRPRPGLLDEYHGMPTYREYVGASAPGSRICASGWQPPLAHIFTSNSDWPGVLYDLFGAGTPRGPWQYIPRVRERMKVPMNAAQSHWM